MARPADGKIDERNVGSFPMKSRHLLATLTLRLAKGGAGEGQTRRGHLRAGPITFPCALGKSGISHRKREGDKATPAGSFRLLYGYYRRDRGPSLGPGSRPARLS